MSLIEDCWKQNPSHVAESHTAHINPQFPQVLQIIGFNKNYRRAKGAELWEDDGESYLDFLAGYSVFNCGHNAPEILTALQTALHSDWPNLLQMDLSPLSAELASQLTRRDPTGRLKYAYFGNSGAEAVECALKFARCATGRSRILSFDGGFHGLSLGALSVCGDSMWQEGFGPFLPGCVRVPYGDLGTVERELSNRDVAALIIEPIQGEGGVRELDLSQWRDMQAICRKYGTLLILDEVQTGIGRTGKFFAFEHWGIEPDLVCLSKALTNGMVPCSATLGTAAIFEKVFNRMDRCVVHSSTYGENNLAMAAALAVLRMVDEQQLTARAAESGQYVINKLRSCIGGMEMVREIRGRGLMFAIEFGAPESLKLRMSWSILQKANKGLFGQMLTSSLLTRHRILTQVAGHNLKVWKFSPPLVVSNAQLDRFIQSVHQVVEDIHRFPGGVWEFGLDLAKRAISAQLS